MLRLPLSEVLSIGPFACVVHEVEGVLRSGGLTAGSIQLVGFVDTRWMTRA